MLKLIPHSPTNKSGICWLFHKTVSMPLAGLIEGVSPEDTLKSLWSQMLFHLSRN